jgi:hypothetical protein
MAPRGGIVDPAQLEDGDLISYRELTREDFRASALPRDADAYAKRIGALTCARIRTTPETNFRVQGTDDGSSVSYVGAFQTLAFHAQMDRNCSWWNQQNASLPEAYVLQHEQIHFALTELAARHLNQRAPAVIEKFRATGTSEEEVQQQFQAKLEELIEAEFEDLLDVNREFDEDTSAKHAPELQQEWFDRVMADLARTGGR